jgi:crotonobetainyl-CoA:carnitine CoA-transferase CaiB-like acyl-CoA transferase
LRTRRRDDWVSALEGASVPSGPINTIAQVFEDPQVRHRGMRVEAPHPLAGRVSMVRNPIRLSATPVTHAVAPPTLGQHTDAVLGELLGLSAEEISRLREGKIL